MSRLFIQHAFCDYCGKEITDQTLYALKQSGFLKEQNGFDACCKEHFELLRKKQAEEGVRMLLKGLLKVMERDEKKVSGE